MYFTSAGAWAKISVSDSGREVHCMPLYSILLAMNRTSIDFFSLDIEGNELDVLRTLPFDKVDIKVRKFHSHRDFNFTRSFVFEKKDFCCRALQYQRRQRAFAGVHVEQGLL